MNCRVKSCLAMSLVEVILAIGILVFCAVSLMGLLPVMLNATRESNEIAVVARIYQTVSSDLRENFGLHNGPWYFGLEGLHVRGAQTGYYRATTDNFLPANLAGSTNVEVGMVLITVENTARGTTNLIRPVYVSHGTN